MFWCRWSEVFFQYPRVRIVHLILCRRASLFAVLEFSNLYEGQDAEAQNAVSILQALDVAGYFWRLT